MKKLAKLSAFFIILGLLIGVSPVAAFAKDGENNGNGKGKEKKEISSSKEDRKDNGKGNSDKKEEKENWFFSKFRHFLTFGAGKSGKVPPGIYKKIGHISTTTTSVLPVISDIEITRTATTSVRISWETNKYATSKIYFSPTKPVATTTGTVANSSQGGMNHTVTLKNLATSTTYYYVVAATDANGKTTSSSELSFATLGGPVLDTVAPVLSNITASSTSNGVRVQWNTNESASSKVWFGTTSPVLGATSTQSIIEGAFVTSHDIALPALQASTTYYFMVSSSDASGNTSTSAEYNFNVLP